jgi:hypothetical protein
MDVRCEVKKMRGKGIIKNVIILGILLMFILQQYVAGDEGNLGEDERAWAIEIKKSAPQEIRIGELANITIEVINNYHEALSVILREVINFGIPIEKENLIQPQNITEKKNVTIIHGVTWLHRDGKCEVGCVSKDKICDPDCKCSAAEDLDCADFLAPLSPYYEWKFALNNNETKIISYLIKPFGIGIMRISPTIAETKLGKFYSNPLEIKVRCNGNGICEKNENFKNCQEDCPSGSKDGHCDKVKDGICDPDCPKEVDPDCIPARCGNFICETKKGENYQNCPEDCPKPVICGDFSCDKKENFANCPQDCPSGEKDNYCDGVKDKRCDPDCHRSLDEDCLATIIKFANRNLRIF